MATSVDLDRARAAKARLLQVLPKRVRLNGVGITQVGEDYAVKLNLAERPRPDVILPKEVDGVRVVIEVIGPISKQST